MAAKEFQTAQHSLQSELEGVVSQSYPATLGNAESQPLRKTKQSFVDQNALRVRANLPQTEEVKIDTTAQDAQSLCCMALIAWRSKKEGYLFLAS